MPGPAEMLPGLDEDQLRVLGEVGQAWAQVSDDADLRRHELPVDPDLGGFPSAEDIGPDRFGRMVRVATLGTATAPEEAVPSSGAARAAYRVRHALIGAPLKSTAVTRERMRKLVALPVLSADALSSVAYGPEAMLAVLVLAGTAGLGWTTPIAAAIAFLMLAVGVSYRQTIRAYPHGGGSYIVAGDNLGRVPGLVAAAGLMTDYILTVAVSIASGVAAITSALPSLSPYTVPIGAGVIALLLVGNLRGLRQAGALFAAPTYAFIIAMFVLVGVGLSDAAGRDFHATPTPHLNATEGVGVLLVMRAFASGSTAMTGIEAISNAVPAFQPTEWRNARTTLTWMICLLITLFAGVTALARLDGVVPRSGETVLSQLAHRSFGSGPMYVFTQIATAAVLLLAANTAYNDFPGCCSCWPATGTRRGCSCGWATGSPSATASGCCRWPPRWSSSRSAATPRRSSRSTRSGSSSPSRCPRPGWCSTGGGCATGTGARACSSTPPAACCPRSSSSPRGSPSSPRAPGWPSSPSACSSW